MDSELLKLGLNKDEALLFTAFLKHGSKPLKEVAKKIKLSPKRASVACKGLVKKNLLHMFSAKGGKVYTAADPNLLLAALDEKAKALLTLKESAPAIVQQLLAIQLTVNPAPKIRFFVGVEGARAAFDDTLNAKEKTLRAFLSLFDMRDFLGAEYFEKYTKRRVASGLSVHVIRTIEQDKLALKRDKNARRYMSNRDERREVRYVSDDVSFPLTVYLYDQKVLCISNREQNFAFILENREFAEMLRRVFQVLWKALAIREISASRWKV